MKKTIISLVLLFLLVFALSLSASAEEASADLSAAEKGRAALIATGHSSLLHFPEEEDYLPEWKTCYARKAFFAPCLEVKSLPDMYDNYYPNMPYLYEGMEVTVVAEHGDMSCFLYDGINNKHYCGWIKSIRLRDAFPGKFLTVGEEKTDGYTVLSPDFDAHEEYAGYHRFWYPSTAFPAVDNCLGFQLEYQMIAENVDVNDYAYAVYGPRKVYVCDGENWIEAGSFEYSEPHTVKVTVWLDHPMTVTAVGTVPVCAEPDLPLARQIVKEFYLEN